MVKGYHHLVSCHPLLFFNFRTLNIKAIPAHHPIIKKEVDELLAMGAIEPYTGGVGFYSNLVVVPNHIGGLHPILNLQKFNHYMHIPTFKMPSVRQVQQVIQQVIMFFLLISRMLIYIFLLLSICITFYGLFGDTFLINGRFCLLVWLWLLGFTPPLLKP